VPSGLSAVKAVATGVGHTLALKQDGTVVAWGGNWYGEATVPDGLSDVVAIAAGGNHSLALRRDGTVVAWGLNHLGQATVPGGLSNVVAIAAGHFDSFAVRHDGTVVAWGSNWPDDPATVPSGLRDVKAVAAGWGHILALKQDGTVVAWGINDYGQSTVPSGLSGVVAISANWHFSLALKQDGTVVAWGDNSSGQSTVPTSLSNVVAIAAGMDHAVALVYPGQSEPVIRRSPKPESQTAEAGSNADLQVMAEGCPPLAYQWFFNATNVLSDSTNSFLYLPNLHLPKLQPSQSGAYAVRITNAFGAVTSAPAMLNVIPPVPRRAVPALTMSCEVGSALNVDFTANLGTSPNWMNLNRVVLTNTPQIYFDLSAPLSPQRFYHAWHSDASAAPAVLELKYVPAITLTGAIGSSVRIDYINQFGPIDAWVPLATVTLTDTSQLYFDTSAVGLPPRLYRVVTVP